MNWYIHAEDGQEDAMPMTDPSPATPKPIASEEQIRTRSYLLWEREGRQDGKSQEYWQRAKQEVEAELEAKWLAASMEGETTSFVLPLLPISTPPARSVSSKLPVSEELRKKAS